jgi:hypothetical protein
MKQFSKLVGFDVHQVTIAVAVSAARGFVSLQGRPLWL